jgi:hypothetical protein
LDSKERDFRKELNDRYCCYVLITCTTPSKEGNMQVNLTYEGDESLASYLIENAQMLLNPEQSSDERVD